MTLSSSFRGGLCGLTLALSFGVAHATDRLVPSQYPTIQAAINAAANSGDRVLVADGTYNEHDIDFGTKNLEVRSASDNPANCIVDAQQLGRGFFINGGQTSTTILRGFTVRNAGNVSYGGAVYQFSNGTITNCIFSGNSAGLRGAGVYNKLGSVSNCLFSGNSAPFGGGLFLDSSDKVSNCAFIDNSGTIGGGAFNVGGTIVNCNFIRNFAQSDGGGINSTFGTIANCTIVNNSSSYQIGGLENFSSTVVNCIIYGNKAPSFPNITGLSTYLFRNLVEGLPSTPNINGNFGADPNFVNPAAGDYRLQWPSPAIDKGNNAAVAGFTTDLAENARISRGTVDLGAYEYQDRSAIVDAGSDQVVAVPHDGDPNTNTASVALNATVYDPEGDITTFQWSGNNTSYPTNVNPTVALPAGVYTFTLTVTEPSGAVQIDTVQITVTPEANAAPIVSDQSVSLNQDSSATVTLDGTDPDGDAVSYTIGTPAHGTVTGTAPNLTYTPAAGYVGSDSFTVTVKDAYGASNTATISLTVKDTIAPVITLSGFTPMTVGQGTTFTDPGATATDNIDGNLPVTVSGSVNTASVGSYTLTYTATDSAGNSASKTRVVNVLDLTPPVITLSGSDPMTVAQGSTFTDPGATATDNVDGSVPVTVSGSVNTASVGSYVLTYTASDSFGNTARKTRTVRVVDTTAPVITLNGSDPMSVPQGSTFTDPGATAVDNVDGSVPVSVSGSVNTATPGSYTLTYTATDSAGNTARKNRTVNVVAPVSSSKIVVSLKELESDDDCGRGNGGEVEAEFSLKNTGTVAEDNVTITSVTLGGVRAKGKLPQNLGTIKAGKKEEAEFEFRGVRRGTYTLKLTGTSSKGSFSFTQTVTIR